MRVNQIKLGTVLSYFNLLISLAVGFITVPIITKTLGINEYGVYTLAASLIGYMSILDFGMHNVVIRYVAKYNAKKEEKEKENFLAISFVIFFVISLIVLVIGILIYQNLTNIFGNSMTNDEITLLR